MTKTETEPLKHDNRKIFEALKKVIGEPQGIFLDLDVLQRYTEDQNMNPGTILDTLNRHEDYRVVSQTILAIMVYDLKKAHIVLEGLRLNLKRDYDDVLRRLDAEAWSAYDCETKPALVPGIMLGFFQAAAYAYENDFLGNILVEDFGEAVADMLGCRQQNSMLWQSSSFFIDADRKEVNKYRNDLAAAIKSFVSGECKKCNGFFSKNHRVLQIFSRLKDCAPDTFALGKEIKDQLTGKMIGLMHEHLRIQMICAAAEHFEKNKARK